MSLDPDNHVVRLCVAGLACESDHRFEDALSLYMRAWDESSDDFESCIAAHYVARQQRSIADALRWNFEALHRANSVQDNRTREFYPSLYLNIGKSYEEAGDQEQAAKFFRLAAEKLTEIPNGHYRDSVADGVQRATMRVSPR